MQLSDKIYEKLKDWKFRINFLYTILTEDNSGINGVNEFRLREAQKELLDEWHNRIIINKCRKIGYSSLLMLIALDSCLFNKNFRASVIDFKETSAFDKLEMAYNAWNNSLPFYEKKAETCDESAVIRDCWKVIKQKIQLVNHSKGELRFSNGSILTASTTTMGSSPHLQILSELGPISSQRPDTAAKLKRGTLNSVSPDSTLVIESTAEGSVGVYYDLLQLALSYKGKKDLDKTEYKLLFKPWFLMSSYTLSGKKESDLDDETIQYFEQLKQKEGIVLTVDQMAWYQSKKREIGSDIYSQFPSTFEESIKTSTTNSIYPEMINFKSKGRIRHLEMEKAYEFFTVWDLGARDATAGILFQVCGRELLLHRFYSSTGQGADGVVKTIKKWQRDFDIHITKNIFPHDCNRREVATAKSYYEYLREYGLSSSEIAVLDRTDNVWTGIRNARQLFNNMWMSTRMNDVFIGSDGESLPSLVQSLENYKRNNRGDAPLHDIYSHAADSFRYLAEAMTSGLVKNTMKSNSFKKNRPNVQNATFVGI